MPKGWKSRQKDQSGNIENKRWTIEQIKYFLDSAAENYFLAKLFEHIESLRNSRTIFLSTLSLAVAIVLGIRNSIDISINHMTIGFVDVLVFLLVVSAGGILIIELAKNRLSRHIVNIGQGFKAINLRLDILRGFMNNASFDIEYFTESNLKNYGKYCMMFYHFRPELIDALNRAAKSITLKWHKSNIENYSRLNQGLMSAGNSMFNRYENDFLRNELVMALFNNPLGQAYLSRFRAAPFRPHESL